MEMEKKKNKMTKAEAFEWLKCKKKSEEEKALDEIAELGKKISGLLTLLGGGHVRITVDDVTLYGEGMNLFYLDPFKL